MRISKEVKIPGDLEPGFDELLRNYTFNNRRVYLWGELDSFVARDVIEELNYHADQDPTKLIYLLIHTDGGDTDCQDAIIDTIQSLQGRGILVATVVEGKAYSAGANILAVGSKGYRYARPNANIMMHPCSYYLTEDYSVYQEKLTEFIKKKNGITNRTIAKHIGRADEESYQQFLSDIDKGLWLTAQEALNYGIIDEILCSPLPVFKTGKKGRNGTNTTRKRTKSKVGGISGKFKKKTG
jgi:ATP-dependent Clp protease, protease subunit